MSEATLILPNMRGGCATVGATVHTLFRVNRGHRAMIRPDANSGRTGNTMSCSEDQPSAAATPAMI